jgi:uncharacterized protein YeaO (DUF488 family)
MTILLKRITEAASPADGARVLVDRQRPARVAKNSLALRAWLPDLAPSDELRRWFEERPSLWQQFRRRYLAELCNAKSEDALAELHTIVAVDAPVTLLTSAEDQEQSHAAILRDLLQGIRKPPTTTGPARAAAAGGRMRMRARRNR